MKASYTGTLNPRIFFTPRIAVLSSSSTLVLPTLRHQRTVKESTLAMTPSILLFFLLRSLRKQLAHQPFLLLKSSGFLTTLTTWHLHHLMRHLPKVWGMEFPTKQSPHQAPQRRDYLLPKQLTSGPWVSHFIAFCSDTLPSVFPQLLTHIGPNSYFITKYATKIGQQTNMWGQIMYRLVGDIQNTPTVKAQVPSFY